MGSSSRLPFYGASSQVASVLQHSVYLQGLQHRLFQRLKTLSFKTGHFVLASGQSSSFYLDCRCTALDAEGSWLIGELLYACAVASPSSKQPDAVAGMALGAAPLVTSVTVASAAKGQPVQGVLVRKEAKQHGGGKQVEGNLAPWMRVALLEDVVTTGGSTAKAATVLKQLAPSLTLTGVYSLIDRKGSGAKTFENLNLPYHWLFSIDAFLG